MRCKNCGWPNRPGETFCVKCNSPLETEEKPENSFRATVREADVFGEVDGKICPKCGNQVPTNAEHCPNCNYFVGQIQHTSIDQGEYLRPTRMENPAAIKKELTGTINPYMFGAEPDPTIVLKPLKRVNEKKDPQELEYEGKSIVLNRSNTESDNSSITTQTQAELNLVDGHWYIEDKSEQGTTFVRASKKIELQDGDVILLGNRLFEFHISN
jgi:hypothetical protein